MGVCGSRKTSLQRERVSEWVGGDWESGGGCGAGHKVKVPQGQIVSELEAWRSSTATL